MFKGSKNGNLLEKVLKKSPELKYMVYRPPLILSYGFLNSIISVILTQNHKRIHSKIKLDREIFELSDKGQVALDWKTK